MARDTQQTFMNPIEILEELLSNQELPFHRMSPLELVTEVDGRWGSYRLQYYWQEEIAVLHFSVIFDLNMEEVDRDEIHELLALLNERMILGHFEMFPPENCPAFRYSTLLPNDQGQMLELIEDAMEISLDECERCYPAFQYLQSGEKSALEAASIAVMDTAGEA